MYVLGIMGGAAKRRMGGQNKKFGGFKPLNKKVGGFGLRIKKWAELVYSRIIYELDFLLFSMIHKLSIFQSNNPIQNSLQVNYR